MRESFNWATATVIRVKTDAASRAACVGAWRWYGGVPTIRPQTRAFMLVVLNPWNFAAVRHRTAKVQSSNSLCSCVGLDKFINCSYVCALSAPFAVAYR